MATSTRRQPIWGIAGSALAAPTAFFVYSVGQAIIDGTLSLTGIIVAALAIYFYGFCVSLPASLVIGLPYVLWLEQHDRLAWANVCFAATTLGAFIFLTLWFIAFRNYQSWLMFTGIGAACGLLSGAAFCVVVRPNNSFKPNPLRGSA